MADFRIDDGGLRKLVRDLERLGERDVKRAALDTRRRFKTESKREISSRGGTARGDYLLTQSAVAKRLRVGPVKRDDGFVVLGIGRPISAHLFKVKASKRKGATVSISDSESYRLPHAFRTPGSRLLFMRKPKGTGTAGGRQNRLRAKDAKGKSDLVGRTPLVLITGPSMAAIIENQRMFQKLRDLFFSIGRTQLLRRIDRALKRGR